MFANRKPCACGEYRFATWPKTFCHSLINSEKSFKTTLLWVPLTEFRGARPGQFVNYDALIGKDYTPGRRARREALCYGPGIWIGSKCFFLWRFSPRASRRAGRCNLGQLRPGPDRRSVSENDFPAGLRRRSVGTAAKNPRAIGMHAAVFPAGSTDLPRIVAPPTAAKAGLYDQVLCQGKCQQAQFRQFSIAAGVAQSYHVNSRPVRQQPRIAMMAPQGLAPKLSFSEAPFAAKYNHVPFGFNHNLHHLSLFRDEELRHLCEIYRDSPRIFLCRAARQARGPHFIQFHSRR